MAERPDITELFTPEDYSAGLVFLRRILGCTFDYLWVPGGQSAPSGGTCDNTNDILAQLVTTELARKICTAGIIRLPTERDSFCFSNGGESESLVQTGGLGCEQEFHYGQILTLKVFGVWLGKASMRLRRVDCWRLR